MTVTVKPAGSFATQGSTIFIQCMSAQSSQQWGTSGTGESSVFQNPQFKATADGTCTLAVTIPLNAPTGLHSFQVYDHPEQRHPAEVQMYVLPEGFRSEDMVLVHGNDGNTYLLAQARENPGPPTLTVNLGFTPDIVKIALDNGKRFQDITIPTAEGVVDTGASSCFVTCYVLNLEKIKPG